MTSFESGVQKKSTYRIVLVCASTRIVCARIERCRAISPSAILCARARNARASSLFFFHALQRFNIGVIYICIFQLHTYIYARINNDV